MRSDLVALFRQITSGVYVVGVAHGSRRDAFTAASVMQVSYEPLLIALGINPTHRSYPILKAGRAFTINVLARNQLDVARHFGSDGGPPMDGLGRQELHEGIGGAPILDHALCYFECALVSEMPAGDHRVILGEVVGGGQIDVPSEPLLYRDTGNMDGSAALFPSSFNPRTRSTNPPLLSRAAN